MSMCIEQQVQSKINKNHTNTRQRRYHIHPNWFLFRTLFKRIAPPTRFAMGFVLIVWNVEEWCICTVLDVGDRAHSQFTMWHVYCIGKWYMYERHEHLLEFSRTMYTQRKNTHKSVGIRNAESVLTKMIDLQITALSILIS